MKKFKLVSDSKVYRLHDEIGKIIRKTKTLNEMLDFIDALKKEQELEIIISKY